MVKQMIQEVNYRILNSLGHDLHVQVARLGI